MDGEELRRVVIVSLIVLFILPVASVDTRSLLPPLRGFILFADRNTIVERDLVTSRERILQSVDSKELIEHLSYLPEQRILYDQRSDESAGVIGSRIFLMSLMSTDGPSPRLVTEGVWPTALPGSPEFLFFRWSITRKRFVLMVRDGIDSGNGEHEVEGVSFVLPSTVLPVSYHEVVFSADVGEAPWLYDLRTRRLQRLPIPDCFVNVWLPDEHRLLCWVAGKNRYAVATLDGEIDFLDLDRGYLPLALIKGSHQVVALSARLEAYDLVAVDFTTYADDIYIRPALSGVGGAIWIPS